MIIDAHMHVNHRNFSLKDIIKYLDKNRIDCCWLLTWEEISPKGHYANLCIDDVYDAYLRYPSRIIPMYAPDPHRSDAPQLLRTWHQKGIRGCAELKATLNWQSEKVKTLLAEVSKLDIPILFHMEESKKVFHFLPSDDSLNIFFVKLFRTDKLMGINKRIFNFLAKYYPALNEWKRQRVLDFPGYMLDFASLEATLIEFPNLNFIAHGPMFWKFISANGPENSYPKGPIRQEGISVDLLRKYSNLYADISSTSGYNALRRDRKFICNFLDEFDHKILFGSDNILLNQISYLNSLGLSKTTLNKIFYENASLLLDKPNLDGRRGE
ncbi:MAG: hypothetical protein GY697_01845 [Desulfobacterales bacterium]|nr:hypothetical protein [Desulfobacterales bacterium]